MFGLGPVTSLYDLITFGVLLWAFGAAPELFRSGWFSIGLLVVVSPLGSLLGFVLPPAGFYPVLVLMVGTYALGRSRCACSINSVVAFRY